MNFHKEYEKIIIKSLIQDIDKWDIYSKVVGRYIFKWYASPTYNSESNDSFCFRLRDNTLIISFNDKNIEDIDIKVKLFSQLSKYIKLMKIHVKNRIEKQKYNIINNFLNK